MHYVYLLLCEDGSIYTGITNNPDRRLIEHTSKSGGHYTKSHAGKKFLHKEKFKNKSDAAKRERQIKGWRREKKINLIRYGHPNGEAEQ